MTRARIPLLRIPLLALVAAVLAAVPGAPARAAQDPPASSPIDLTLVAISPYTGPDRPLRVVLRARNSATSTLRDLRVSLLGGPAIPTRSDLQLRLTGASAPAPADQFGTDELDGVSVPAGRVVNLPGVTFELPGYIGDDAQGVVLPIRIAVSGETDDGRAEQIIDTFTVVVSEQVANPLRMSLLAPISEPTHRTPDGVFVDDQLARLLGTNGSLGGMVAELARPGSPAVSLAVDPLVVEEATEMVANGWQLRPAGAAEPETVPTTDPRSEAARTFRDNLRTAANRGGQAPIALPFATADLVALVRNDLEADAAALVAKGRRDLEAALGTTADDSVAWPTGGVIDPQTLRMLGNANVSSVVIGQRQMPVESFQTQNAPVKLNGGSSQPGLALVPDPGLSSSVTDRRASADPALYAQRILAETAIAWLEKPGGTDPVPRGVLIAPPHSWRPTPSFFSALVRGMGAAPWLNVVPVQDLAATVEPGPDADGRTLSPYNQQLLDAELPTGYVRSIARAKASLTSFRSTVPAGYAPAEQFNEWLYVATSSWYRRAPSRARGNRYIRAVQDNIDGIYGKVRVSDTPVTLTSRDGRIQVTTTNSGDVPLTVRLRLSATRVDLPEPLTDTFVINPGKGDTHLVLVRTRATGNFPLKAEVLTADGRSTIAGAEIRVRSTALNWVTGFLMVGTAGFLFIWWLRKRLRGETGHRKHRRRPVPEPEPEPEAEPEAEPGREHTGQSI